MVDRMVDSENGGIRREGVRQDEGAPLAADHDGRKDLLADDADARQWLKDRLKALEGADALDAAREEALSAFLQGDGLDGFTELMEAFDEDLDKRLAALPARPTTGPAARRPKEPPRR